MLLVLLYTVAVSQAGKGKGKGDPLAPSCHVEPVDSGKGPRALDSIRKQDVGVFAPPMSKFIFACLT